MKPHLPIWPSFFGLLFLTLLAPPLFAAGNNWHEIPVSATVTCGSSQPLTDDDGSIPKIEDPDSGRQIEHYQFVVSATTTSIAMSLLVENSGLYTGPAAGSDSIAKIVSDKDNYQTQWETDPWSQRPNTHWQLSHVQPLSTTLTINVAALLANGIPPAADLTWTAKANHLSTDDESSHQRREGSDEEPDGVGNPMANPDDKPRVKVSLLPIEMKVVDRDDPKKKWGSETDHNQSKPVYAGESTGNMVSWKLGGTDTWSSTVFTWTAEGPGGETKTGPTGAGKNEWKIADGDDDTANDWLKWKPGKWKIKVQIGSAQAEFEQEVGVRTEEYFVVGAIKGTPNSTTGVASSTITSYSCPWLVPNILFEKFNEPPSSGGVPESISDRMWVNLQLLNETKNQNHSGSLRPEKTARDAFGLSASDHYRGFGRCQFKYVPQEGKLDKVPTPVNELVQKIGNTPAPCMFDPTIQSLSATVSPGIAHEKSGDFYGDDGNYDKTFSDDTRFHYLLKFMAGSTAQSGYKNLNRRELPWVFFRLWFDMEDGLIKTNFNALLQPNQAEDSGDLSGVPSYYLYRRYYDLQSNGYKIQTIQSFEMGDPDRVKDWMQTISGTVTGTPHYP